MVERRAAPSAFGVREISAADAPGDFQPGRGRSARAKTTWSGTRGCRLRVRGCGRPGRRWLSEDGSRRPRGRSWRRRGRQLGCRERSDRASPGSAATGTPGARWRADGAQREAVNGRKGRDAVTGAWCRRPVSTPRRAMACEAGQPGTANGSGRPTRCSANASLRSRQRERRRLRLRTVLDDGHRRWGDRRPPRHLGRRHPHRRADRGGRLPPARRRLAPGCQAAPGCRSGAGRPSPSPPERAITAAATTGTPAVTRRSGTGESRSTAGCQAAARAVLDSDQSGQPLTRASSVPGSAAPAVMTTPRIHEARHTTALATFPQVTSN